MFSGKAFLHRHMHKCHCLEMSLLPAFFGTERLYFDNDFKTQIG